MENKQLPEWLQKMIHAGDDSKGIRVYYVMAGLKVVCSDVAVKRVGNDLYFADGGWISAKDAFLTKAQARKASGIDTDNTLKKVRKLINELADGLLNADEILGKLEQ
jgi:hypothetical protein